MIAAKILFSFFFFSHEKLLYKMVIIEIDQKLSNMVGLSMAPGEKLEFLNFDMFWRTFSKAVFGSDATLFSRIFHLSASFSSHKQLRGYVASPTLHITHYEAILENFWLEVFKPNVLIFRRNLCFPVQFLHNISSGEMFRVFFCFWWGFFVCFCQNKYSGRFFLIDSTWQAEAASQREKEGEQS